MSKLDVCFEVLILQCISYLDIVASDRSNVAHTDIFIVTVADIFMITVCVVDIFTVTVTDIFRVTVTDISTVTMRWRHLEGKIWSVSHLMPLSHQPENK